MQSARTNGRTTAPLCWILGALILIGCESDGPLATGPLVPVTIRATVPDGRLLQTTFELRKDVDGRQFRQIIETQRGVAETHLPPGSYYVRDVDRDTYLGSEGPVRRPADASPVDVPRYRSTDIEFRYSSVSIRLLDDSGRPVRWSGSRPPAKLDVYFFSPQLLGDSVAVLSPVIPGEYPVGIACDTPPLPFTWYPSAGSALDAEPVRVEAGVDTRVVIRSAPPAWIRFVCPAPPQIASWEPNHSVYAAPSGDPTEHRVAGQLERIHDVLGPLPAMDTSVDIKLYWRSGETRTSRELTQRVSPTAHDTTRVVIPSDTGIEVNLDPRMGVLQMTDATRTRVASTEGSPAYLFADPGSYILSGWDSGRLLTYWPSVPRAELSDPIEITRGRFERIDFSLVRPASVRGWIRTDDGMTDLEIAGTNLRLFGAFPQTSRSEDAGDFALAALWPGTYRLLATPPAQSRFAPTWNGGASDSASSIPITVGPGDHLHDLEIRLRRR